MALQVWLPLSGNISNYGLSDITTDKIGTIMYGSGLFGDKCFDSGDGAIDIQLSSFPSQFTLTMWIKPAAPAIGSTLVAFGDDGDSIDISGDMTSYKWNGGNIVADNTAIFAANDGEWTHVAITADGTNVKSYVNGTLVYTIAQSSTFAASDIYIGEKSDGTGSWSGYIQDVKMYSHVISTRELLDMSMGLVLNYTFNHGGFGNENILTGSQNNLTVSGSSKANYVEDNSMYAVLEAGSYTLSAETTGVWAESNSSNGVTVSDPTDASTFITALELYTLSGDTVADRLFVNMSGGSGTVTISTAGTYYVGGIVYSDGVSDVTATFSRIKLESGVNATAWIPPKGTTEYAFYDIGEVEQDVSGNGLDGVFSETAPIWTDDSGLYSGAYDFSNGSYVESSAIDTSNINAFTVSIWAKGSDLTGKIIYGFDSSPRFNLSTIDGVFGIYSYDTNQQIVFGSGESVADYIGTWHNYVITGDGEVNTLYIDGALIGSTNTYVALGRSVLYANGWDDSTAYNFNGLLSDLRIYARVLSAEQISSLYHVRAAVDNKGRVYSNEFIGTASSFSVSKKGVTKAPEFTVFNTPITAQSTTTDDASRFGISSSSVTGVDLIEM